MLSAPMLAARVEGEALGSVIQELSGWPDYSASYLPIFGCALAVDLLLAGLYGLVSVDPPAALSQVVGTLCGGLEVPILIGRLLYPVLCLAMLSVALEFFAVFRALHWRVPPRIRSQLQEGEHAPKVWKAFRVDMQMAALLLSIVAVLCVAVSAFRPEGPEATLVALVPLAVGLPQDLLSDYLIQFLRAAMETAVRTLRDRVKETAGGSAEDWAALVVEYIHLRQDLAKFTDSLGVLLVASLVSTGWGTFLFFMLSLTPQLVVGWRFASAAVCLLSASTALGKLRPLAKITALCQSTDAESESLLTAAVEGVGGEVVHSMAFTTHVHHFPTGASLPGGIQVTSGLIVYCARALALYSSTAAYFALRVVLGAHGVRREP